MMRMLFNRRCMRAIWRFRTVAFKAQDIGRLQEIGVVVRPVHVVAIGAGNAPRVHHARHEIVPLHAILVRRAVGEMCERLFTRFVLF